MNRRITKLIAAPIVAGALIFGGMVAPASAAEPVTIGAVQGAAIPLVAAGQLPPGSPGWWVVCFLNWATGGFTCK